MMILLEMEKVSYAYKKKNHKHEVLKGVNLKIEKGELVGLYGPSGVGKSTLCQLMMGLRQPDEGQLYLKGQRLETLSVKDYYTSCQMVFQNATRSLNPLWTGRQILAEALRLKRTSPAEVKSLMQMLELEESLLNLPSRLLSGGQKQRLNILRSLLVKPDLLICDEVTSSLDALRSEQVFDLFLAMRQQRQMSFLLISHETDQLNYYCDRLYHFSKGQLAEDRL